MSFSGANTLNSSSPFASLKGSVSFGSNAIFNLNQTLNNNQTYDILTTNGAIQYGVYQSYLWDLINYKGDKAISHVEVGNNTYDVTFDINGQDETLQETFNNQSIITQFLGDNLQQQAQQTYQEDVNNSQNALRGATSDNTIASADTSDTTSKNTTIATDAQTLEKTNQQIQKDEQALEKDLAQIKELANSTTGFNEQAFTQAQKQEQQEEQALQNDENAFNTEQDSLNKAIQQAQAQQQKQEQAQAQETYQEDVANSQNALNGVTSDKEIASADTSYTQSSNPTILKDAQNLENTNQKIQQDEQALEKDLAQIKQLANSTTGFNEQAFTQAQKQEQQEEQTLQNDENAFNTEQEGLKQAIANAKPANPTPSPTPTPTPSPTKHTAPNTPPSQVPHTPTQNPPAENVWNGVYWLQNQTYSNKGIYYIDPNLSGQSGQSGNTLSTYTANLLGRSFGVNANNGTLIIGNNTESVNDNGLIWIGHGGFGYITGTFSAANIYLTNNFKTGEGVSNSDGGGANITFKASDNITMDGLNYNDAETVTKMIQTGASQHSYTTFDATNNISVTNSSFSDMTWGKFSFSAENISFSNASFSGFTNPGGSSTISANASNSLSFIDSRLNGGAVYNLQANSLIFNITRKRFLMSCILGGQAILTLRHSFWATRVLRLALKVC
ncbi:vacuolating cytotoxin family protein [Helicobacter pylori Hp A-5]|nr:vacuolating cytotoxin family protein [Helicobacter pylori Hp A-5]